MIINDELKALRQLIAQSPAGPDLLRKISEEVERIKSVWLSRLGNHAKDYIIKRYTAYQQRLLLELSDRLYRTVDTANSQEHEHELAVLEVLLALGQFQIHNFSRYMDEQGKIPDAMTGKVRAKLSDDADRMSAALQQVELEPGLKTLLLDFLGTLISSTLYKKMMYGQMEYLYQWFEMMEVTISFNDDRDLTYSIIEALFQLNFNYGGFCYWYEQRIVQNTAQVDKAGRHAALQQQSLIVRSLPVRRDMRYDPSLASVDELIGIWLDQFMRTDTVSKNDDEPDRYIKTELKLTVAQLALLLRLLYEEEVFAVKNIASLLKFFTRYFRSKYQERISYGSMNKLYYAADQFTAAAIKDLLQRMIDRLNKMFFPT